MIYGSYGPFSSLWSHHWVTQLSPGQSMCANLDFKCLGWTVLLAWCRNRESNWSCLALSPVRHALNHRFTPSITSADRWLTNCVSVLPPFRVERGFDRWPTVLLMTGGHRVDSLFRYKHFGTLLTVVPSSLSSPDHPSHCLWWWVWRGLFRSNFWQWHYGVSTVSG